MKTDTSYGYEYTSKVVRFERLNWRGTPIKWGFTGDEMEFNDGNFKEQFVVADRKRMDKIMSNTFNNFDNYIDKEMAKILLEGHTAFFNYNDKGIEVSVEVVESCISPKGNCVTHIFLNPLIAIAVEND